MVYRLIFVLFFTITLAQDQSITNLSVSQRTDGSGIVDILYDLNDLTGIFPSFDISVKISYDNGATWSDVNIERLEGDFGVVVPGLNKLISYEADSEVFYPTSKIKLSGEGHFVSSNLPFDTVTISPSAITSFESETIDYSYEIMQYELTNAQLVEWLETYSFDDANNADSFSDTGQAEYTCSNYSDYYFSPNTDVNSYGCMDPSALNFNPNATVENSNCDCIYPFQYTCTDSNAWNFDVSYSDSHIQECGAYDDCSCYYSNFDQNFSSDCNWALACELTLSIGQVDCQYNSDEQIYYFTVYNYSNGAVDAQFSVNEGHVLVYNGCNDMEALNYANEFMPFLQFFTDDDEEGVSSDCIQLSDSECQYECNENYWWQEEDGNSDSNVTISNFSTQHISYEGSAFTIAPGKSDYPVRFDATDCSHSVVLSLYMDYFGLRIPTAGEWMKASRGDNERCWPWMDSTCQTDSNAFCSDIYNCLTEDQENDCSQATAACQEECGSLFSACQGVCIFGDEELGIEPCCDEMNMSPEEMWACENGIADQCPCSDACNPCMDECVANYDSSGSLCMDNPEYGSNGELLNPNCVGEYADYCTEEQCWQDCSNLSYQCENDLYSCTGSQCWDQNVDDNLSCSDCNSIYSSQLEDIINANGDEIQTDSLYIHNLYYNRFNYFTLNYTEYYENDWDDLSAVGQYPTGVSPYGLYDVIGNIPEIVITDNEYFLMGTTPSTLDGYKVWSFCDDGYEYGDFNHQSRQIMDLNGGGTLHRWYGVRFVRTVSE